MIGPGWLPGLKPRATRKNTLAYRQRRTRARTRAKVPSPPVARASSPDLVLFDHGPSELPVATVIPHEPRARAVALLADLERWVAARWAWFKPRTVPCAVAGLGMIAVIASANYLAHQHDNDAPHAPRIVHISVTTR